MTCWNNYKPKQIIWLFLCRSYSQSFQQLVCVCVKSLGSKSPTVAPARALVGSTVSLRLNSDEATRPWLRTSGMALTRYYPAERVPFCLPACLTPFNARARAHDPCEVQIWEKPRFEFLTCSADGRPGDADASHRSCDGRLSLFSRPAVTWAESISVWKKSMDLGKIVMNVLEIIPTGAHTWFVQ